MKCKCLLETFVILKGIFAFIWWYYLLHSYPLSPSSCKHMSFDLKPNQEKYNFISAYCKLSILTENNVQFLIMKNARKRLFPTFVQTLVLNMTFFFTVVIQPEQGVLTIASFIGKKIWIWAECSRQLRNTTLQWQHFVS